VTLANIYLGISISFLSIFWIVFFAMDDPKKTFWSKIGLSGAIIITTVGIYIITTLK